MAWLQAHQIAAGQAAPLTQIVFDIPLYEGAACRRDSCAAHHFLSPAAASREHQSGTYANRGRLAGAQYLHAKPGRPAQDVSKALDRKGATAKGFNATEPGWRASRSADLVVSLHEACDGIAAAEVSTASSVLRSR